MRPGLVSITFRGMTPARIVDLVARAGLEGIEWGGDVHVPHGDLATAKEVRKLTREAGLAVAAYGSYYHSAESEDEGLSFAKVLDTATDLGAPTVRVWAGGRGSAEADEAYRSRVAGDLRRVGQLAGDAGVIVACEYHGGTLTDTNESAQALMREVAHPNVRLYWQPTVGKGVDYCRDGLAASLPHLANLHVFHWRLSEGGHDQRPLAEGEGEWLEYLRLASSAPVRSQTGGADERWALLEFVRGESPEQFLEDAATLRRWLVSVAS